MATIYILASFFSYLPALLYYLFLQPAVIVVLLLIYYFLRIQFLLLRVFVSVVRII